MIVQRILAKKEIVRLYKTDDAYVYGIRSGMGYDSNLRWSCLEADFAPVPADMPGADYVVDNNFTLSTPNGNEFYSFGGGSMTIGRLGLVASKLDQSDLLVTNAVGVFNQRGVSTNTIADLRLNCGKIVCNKKGQGLVATSITVNAPKSCPFEISAPDDAYTYTISGSVCGGGWLEKTGGGSLDLWSLNSTLKTGGARVILSDGMLSTPYLDGYTGGTVLMDQSKHTINVREGADIAWPMTVKLVTTIVIDKTYTLLTMPTSVRVLDVAKDIVPILTCRSGCTYELQVVTEDEVQKVCVVGKSIAAPIPDEDKGSVPVLIGK